MRTFAQKQKQPQRPVSPGFARSNATILVLNNRAGPLLQRKLKVGEPNDKFEQEADRVADRVMNMPAAPRLGAALGISASVYPSSGIQPRAVIQRQPKEADAPNALSSVKEEDKKPNLEFRSTMGFVGVPIARPNERPESIQTPELPEEDMPFMIGWRVWNTGWKTAPEHHNSITIYDARRCTGCRSPDDEIHRSETPAPSIVSVTQQGQSEYEESFTISGLRAGHYEAVAQLDSSKEVDEMKEDNNTAFMVFDVKPEPKSGPAEEDKTIQPKRDPGPALAAEPGADSQISGFKGGGEPLPQSVRDFFEPRFGHDFSRVRIHSDARAAESARRLHAKAFTLGRDVVFGEGQYALEKPEGRHLLAHELTHVVQQTQPSPFNVNSSVGRE